MYEARAAVLEGTKDYAKADEVFTKGIKLGARRGLRTDANSRKLGRYHALWVLDSHTALPRSAVLLKAQRGLMFASDLFGLWFPPWSVPPRARQGRASSGACIADFGVLPLFVCK